MPVVAAFDDRLLTVLASLNALRLKHVSLISMPEGNQNFNIPLA